MKFITRIHGVPVAGVHLIPSKLQQLRNQIFTSSLIQVWASSENKIGKIKDIIEEQNSEILIVDDCLFNVAALKSLLLIFDYQCDSCIDG